MVEPMKCPKCGAQLTAGLQGSSVFIQCVECGHEMRVARTDRKGTLGGADIVALCFTALGVLALIGETLYLRTFEEMFRDFGGGLPAFTTLVLRVKLPAVLAGSGVALAVIGIALRLRSLPGAIEALIAAAVLACGGAALCLYAFYLPIYSIAGAIK